MVAPPEPVAMRKTVIAGETAPLRVVLCLCLCLCLLLSSCSAWIDTSAEPPAGPPIKFLTVETIQNGIARAASEAHLPDPLEVSPLRKSYTLGSEFLCLRQAGQVNQPPRAVFFDDGEYKGGRLSAIMEECERQTYSPFTRPAPPPAPATSACGPSSQEARDCPAKPRRW